MGGSAAPAQLGIHNTSLASGNDVMKAIQDWVVPRNQALHKMVMRKCELFPLNPQGYTRAGKAAIVTFNFEQGDNLVAKTVTFKRPEELAPNMIAAMEAVHQENIENGLIIGTAFVIVVCGNLTFPMPTEFGKEWNDFVNPSYEDQNMDWAVFIQTGTAEPIDPLQKGIARAMRYGTRERVTLDLA